MVVRLNLGRRKFLGTWEMEWICMVSRNFREMGSSLCIIVSHSTYTHASLVLDYNNTS